MKFIVTGELPYNARRRSSAITVRCFHLFLYAYGQERQYGKIVTFIHVKKGLPYFISGSFVGHICSASIRAGWGAAADQALALR